MLRKIAALVLFSFFAVGCLATSRVENFESFPVTLAAYYGYAVLFGGTADIYCSSGFVVSTAYNFDLCGPSGTVVAHDGNLYYHCNGYGSSMVIRWVEPQNVFSGYFDTTNFQCGSPLISFTFSLDGIPVHTETVTYGVNGGHPLVYTSFNLPCFDSVLIAGDYICMDTLYAHSCCDDRVLLTTLSHNTFENGNMFDLIGLQSVGLQVTAFDLYAHDAGDGSTSIYVYFKLGTYSGFQSSPGSWTLKYVAADRLVAGESVFYLPPDQYITVPAYGTVGIYITRQSGHFLDSQNSSSDQNDGVLRVVSGKGLSFAFSPISGSRVWNGRVHYREVGDDGLSAVAACPGNIVTGMDSYSCNARVTFQTRAQDNCGVSSITSSPASGSVFQKGTTSVTSTVTDKSERVSTCTFSVTVQDDLAPRVTCPDDIRVSAAAGTCSASVTYSPAPSAVDNCGSIASSIINPSSTLFSVGTNKVTYTATDSAGLFSVCDFTVTVEDTQPPTITCPSNIQVNSLANLCSAVVSFPTNSYSVADNCGSTSVIFNPASGFTFPVGTTPVTATVIDGAGLQTTCQFTVTVLDSSHVCLCGNGKIDAGEQCEVNQLGSATCITQSFPDGGVLECTSNCQYDTSRCARCGDGRIDGSEQCDGNNLNGETCQSKGFSAGQLSCSGSCRYDTTQCYTCGDGVIQGSEQCDGNNLNGKTCTSLLGTGAGVTGSLTCSTSCQFNTSSCVVPVVTYPTASTVIAHQYLGIQVTATNFVDDRKVTVTISDGVRTKSYTGVSLTLPSGSINAVFQAPSPLSPSSQWKVTVKGESSLYSASSPTFVVQAM